MRADQRPTPATGTGRQEHSTGAAIIRRACAGQTGRHGFRAARAWFFMRISGLLLVFLAVGHLFIMHIISQQR